MVGKVSQSRKGKYCIIHTEMRCLEKSDSQRQKTQWGSPGAAARGLGGVVM